MLESASDSRAGSGLCGPLGTLCFHGLGRNSCSGAFPSFCFLKDVVMHTLRRGSLVHGWTSAGPLAGPQGALGQEIWMEAGQWASRQLQIWLSSFLIESLHHLQIQGRKVITCCCDPSHHWLAFFLSKGQKAEAEKFYLRAIQLDPAKGNCYMHYGKTPHPRRTLFTLRDRV